MLAPVLAIDGKPLKNQCFFGSFAVFESPLGHHAAADNASAAAFFVCSAPALPHAKPRIRIDPNARCVAYMVCVGQQRNQPFWLSLDAWRLLTSCVMKYTGTPIAQRITERSIFFGATWAANTMQRMIAITSV